MSSSLEEKSSSTSEKTAASSSSSIKRKNGKTKGKGKDKSGASEGTPKRFSCDEWKVPQPQTEEELKAAIAALKGDLSLPRLPIPQPPQFSDKEPVKARLQKLQSYLNAFQYNHTGTRYFPVVKNRGLIKVTTTAKTIMADALPIQCLEAVFLSVYLTCEWRDVERVPISLKSIVDGHVFRHIILAIKHKERWGALGLSRKKTLAFKPLKFNSLSELIADYAEAYKEVWHELVKVYVGFPFSHDPFSPASIKWRVLCVRLDNRPWESISSVLDLFGKEMRSVYNSFRELGSIPDSFKKRYAVDPDNWEDEDIGFDSGEELRKERSQRRREKAAAEREKAKKEALARTRKRISRKAATDTGMKSPKKSVSSVKQGNEVVKVVAGSAKAPKAPIKNVIVTESPAKKPPKKPRAHITSSTYSVRENNVGTPTAEANAAKRMAQKKAGDDSDVAGNDADDEEGSFVEMNQNVIPPSPSVNAKMLRKGGFLGV